MQYTIEIDGVSVLASQLNMVLTIDKTLDYGSFAVRNQVAEPYLVGDMVDIDISDGVDTKSFHFIISADDVTQLPSGYYLHTINIIELTKILEWHTEGNRTFTQRLDDDKLSLLDVIVRLQFTTPIEAVENLGNTRIFAIDNDIRARLAAIESPDFQFSNKNLKEILMEVFDFIDAIPRLTKISDSITLTADFYNDRGSLVTQDAFYNMERLNINDYSTSIDADLKNLYDGYTDIAEPSESGYMKLTSEEGYVTEDNAFLKTQYPIVEIVSLKLKTTVTSGSPITGTTQTEVELDLTDYILEKEAWDLLENKRFSQALSSGNYRDNTLFFERFSQNIDGLFDVVGAVSIAEAITQNTETRINNVIRTAVFQQEDLTVNSFPDFDELEFQIIYKAQLDSRTEVKRLNTEVIKYDSQTIVGQSENVVRADRVLDRLFKLQQLLGNAEIMTSERATAVDDLFNLGDYTADDYVLTTIEMQCNKEYVMAKYMWSLRYQKVSDFIGLNSEIRLYTIPQASYKRNIYLEDFIEVSTEDRNNDSYVGILGISTFMNTFDNSPLTADNKPVRLLAFNSESTVEFEGYDNEENTFIRPVTAYAGGNSLNFHVEFGSSTIVGNQLVVDSEDLEPPLNFPVIYTDNLGQVFDFNFRLVNDYTIDDPNDLPIVELDNLVYKHVESPNIRIYKDTREEFALTYALHVIPEGDLDDTIIIGKYLVERNNLLKSISNESNQFEVFGTNTPYTLADNRFSRSTDTVVAQTHSIILNRLLLSGTVGYSTWGIRRADTKELVVAVNQGSTPITSLYFNFRDRQTGVTYPNQTSQPSAIVKRPTQIAINPGTGTPTGSEIDIVWVDGNTDPVADEFEIGISDDLVNWTTDTQTPAVTNSYSFENLLSYTRYIIRLRARIDTDYSEWAYFEATTTAPSPNAPTNLTLSLIGDRRIFVEWEAEEDVFIHRIELSEESDFSVLKKLKQTFFLDTDTQFDFIDDGIEYDTQYYIRVRVIRDGQFSPYTSDDITTSESPITSPPTITNVSINGSTVSYTLVNTDNQLVTLFSDLSTGATQRSTNVRPNEAVQVSQSFGGSDSTIFAKAEAALKAASTIVSFEFAADEPPGTVSISSIVIEPGYNSINWFYSTASPLVDGFVVERNPNLFNSAVFDEISPVLSPTRRQFVDYSINSGQQYTYRIKAFNRQGSSTSAQQTITSATSVPNAPSSLSLVATLAGDPGQAVVAIEWQRNSTDESGFIVERKLSTQGSASWEEIGGTSKAQTYFEDVVDGAANTNYDYRIIAYNEFGNSSPSNILTVNVA